MFTHNTTLSNSIDSITIFIYCKYCWWCATMITEWLRANKKTKCLLLHTHILGIIIIIINRQSSFVCLMPIHWHVSYNVYTYNKQIHFDKLAFSASPYAQYNDSAIAEEIDGPCERHLFHVVFAYGQVNAMWRNHVWMVICDWSQIMLSLSFK